MSFRYLFAFMLVISLRTVVSGQAQVVLEADGPGDTYELINSVLAPGGNVVEHPECIHPEFGRHVVEVWDNDLSQYVFEFYSHVTPDNDRCINLDRQRMEIKTFASSPDHLKGVAGEHIVYKWKFRLPQGFQPSSSFTHIHQIKAVGGDDGMPLITLTPRKSSPNRLELKHNNTTNVATIPLSLLEGVWVECTETVTVGVNGRYALEMIRVSDGVSLLSYSNDNIMTMRPDNDFIRPKWGIYRSLNNAQDLRDEAVRFAGFSIEEITAAVDGTPVALAATPRLLGSHPNPFNPMTHIQIILPEPGWVSLRILDIRGREIRTLFHGEQPAGVRQIAWNGATNTDQQALSGPYFVVLTAGSHTETSKILLLR